MAVVLGNMSTLIGLMSSDSRTSPSALSAQDEDGGASARQSLVHGAAGSAPAWPDMLEPPAAP